MVAQIKQTCMLNLIPLPNSQIISKLSVKVEGLTVSSLPSVVESWVPVVRYGVWHFERLHNFDLNIIYSNDILYWNSYQY